MNRIIRLHIPDVIESNGIIYLASHHQHYLFNVMRAKLGEKVRIFNQSCGEWNALILSKKELKAIEIVCAPKIEKRKCVALSLIKNTPLELAIQKLTELGITDIFLLSTDFSNQKFPNLLRLNRIAIEATEQCERMCVPVIHKPQSLKLFIMENSGLHPVCLDKDALKTATDIHGCPIIGPEGGFSTKEMELMSTIDHLKVADNILRSETAAIIAASRIV